MSVAPARATPVLRTSLSSAALLDGRGDLELASEMRGASVDWGGVIGQCVRLTGPWRIGLHCGGQESGLPATLVSTESLPGAWTSRHRWNGFEILHRVIAVGELPGVVRTLRVERTSPSVTPLTITSAFSPFLLPVLVEGIRPRSFRVETTSGGVRVRQRGFGLVATSNVLASELSLNRGSWLGGKYRGPVDAIELEYTLPDTVTAPFEWRGLIAGGLDRDIDTWGATVGKVLDDPSASAAAVDAADRAWLAATPTLRFPDAPALERGYESARAALRRLYSAPGDGLTGLVAGYPWYAALWGRDLAWMLWAVLWLGDFDWARASIDTSLRFQSRSSVPLLAGEPGELAMQISPGPIFFYGTSDTTLYYPLLLETLCRHVGIVGLSAEERRAVREMIAWGERRTDPTTGLLRNGGEAEEISAATASLARVRCGINAPDTTIWDSTDRRDHAIDVQVLWFRALRAAAVLLEHAPEGSPGRWRKMANLVAGSVQTRYPWGAEDYLHDSFRDGTPTGQVRPNALRAVSAGLFPPADARRLVRRAARDDLTTPWGMRTLSSKNAGYDPIAYHDGQVWTIATAWAADAAFVAGDADLGVRYLTTIAERYDAEQGFANECYRGDRPEASNSCFLLGFSVAPFLTALFDRLWGIVVDARAGSLSVHPTFPSGWRSASIERLRIGAGTVALDWTPARLRVTWTGPGTLTVDSGADPVTVTSGSPTDVPLPS
jgi:glycogen debranching enzyme